MTFLMQRFQGILFQICQDNKTDFELKAREDRTTLVQTLKEVEYLTLNNPTTRTTNHKFLG